jgi:uncharacterized membrane protein YqjE
VKDNSSPKGDVIAGRFGPERTPPRSISAIVQEMIAHIGEILRSEIRLAKAELTVETGKAMRRASWMVASIVLSLYAFGFLLLGATYGLALFVPQWLAAVIIGGSLAVVAALLFRRGRRELTEFHPKLEKTTQTLKEDISWIKKSTT